MIHVLTVTDCPLFRLGIRATLEKTGDCRIVGESTEPTEVIELVKANRPDVILLDTSLFTVDALEMARLLHQYASYIGGIFVLTPADDEETLFHFIKWGAVACEKHAIEQQELVEKVRRVSMGEYLIDSNILIPSSPLYHPNPIRARDIDMTMDDNAIPASLPISSREREILELIAKGKSNKEIGKLLEISDQTVKNHITSILKKLHVNDRTAAVVYAIRERWIKLDDM
jgi:DNA-binding NarL/FixJ family response regulator